MQFSYISVIHLFIDGSFLFAKFEHGKHISLEIENNRIATAWGNRK